MVLHSDTVSSALHLTVIPTTMRCVLVFSEIQIHETRKTTVFPSVLLDDSEAFGVT